MKIPSENSQFSKEPSLFIVTGTQEAVVYWAKDGEVEVVLRTVAEKKEDTDREGIFRAQRPNMVHHGVSFEDKQQKLKDKSVKDFLKRLPKELKGVKEVGEVVSVFLFTPDFMEEEIKNVLPSSVKDKIKNTFSGNFIKEHTLELVKKIDSFRQGKKVIPTDEDAVKILNIGKNKNQR